MKQGKATSSESGDAFPPLWDPIYIYLHYDTIHAGSLGPHLYLHFHTAHCCSGWLTTSTRHMCICRNPTMWNLPVHFSRTIFNEISAPFITPPNRSYCRAQWARKVLLPIRSLLVEFLFLIVFKVYMISIYYRDIEGEAVWWWYRWLAISLSWCKNCWYPSVQSIIVCHNTLKYTTLQYTVELHRWLAIDSLWCTTLVISIYRQLNYTGGWL